MNNNAKPHYSSKYIVVIMCFVFALTLTACGNNDIARSDNAIENGNNEDFQNNDDLGLTENIGSDPEDQENATSSENGAEYNSAPRGEIDFSTSQEFSLSSSNNTPPEDVLYEVSWAGGFGGGGEDEDICSTSYSSPTIVGHIDNLEWTDSIEIWVCGWQPNEKIQVTIQNETGGVIYDDEIVVISNPVHFQYYVPTNTSYGSYNMTFEGEQSGKVIQSLTIEKPTGSRIYRVENGLLLYNFEPNKRIRLLAFSEFSNDCSRDYYLAGWQEYQINDQGYLIIQLTNDISSVCAFVVSDNSEILAIYGHAYAVMTPKFPEESSGNFVYDCDDYSYIQQETIDPGQISSPISTSTTINLDEPSIIAFRSGNNMFTSDPNGNDIHQVGDLPSGIHSQLSPNGDKIVFVVSENGMGNIFLTNIDGTEVKQLTDDSLDHTDPHWSTDGNRIYFRSYTTDGYYISSIDIDGRNQTRFNNKPLDFPTLPFVSPNEAYVAIIDRVQQNSLSIMEKGLDPVFVTQASYEIAWSPDGQQLAFFQSPKICIYNVFQEELNCHSQLFSWVSSLEWSPNGEYIVAEGVLHDTLHEQERIPEIFLLWTNSTNSICNLSQHPFADDMAPVWSPTSDSLAFTSNRDGYYEIYTVDVNGKNLVRLTYLENSAWTFGWSHIDTSSPSSTITPPPTITAPTSSNIMDVSGVLSDLPVIYRMEVREDFVYATTEESTFIVIDVSDPTNPLQIGSTENPDYARATDIKIVDGFAYVTYGNLIAGLIIIDISDPYNPHEVGRFENDEFMSGNHATGVAIHNNFAFISHHDDGLWVIDISDPSKPIRVASGNFPINADDIVIRDTFAFLAMRHGEFKIVDISAPTHPNEISSLMLSGSAGRKIEIVGDYLYILVDSRNTDTDGGIHIVDISSPYSPILVDFYTLPDVYKIAATQALVFLGTQNGLRILSVSDPTNPTEIAEYNEFDNINAIFVQDNLLFLAVNDTQQGKLVILTLSQNFVNEN